MVDANSPLLFFFLQICECSIFEYSKSGKPRPRFKDHTCEISVPWDHWLDRNLQKLEKFGKIRTFTFRCPSNGLRIIHVKF